MTTTAPPSKAYLKAETYYPDSSSYSRAGTDYRPTMANVSSAAAPVGSANASR